MTTIATSTQEKLEKLTKVALWRNWSAPAYAKLVGQLKDSSQELDGYTTAQTIIGAQDKKSLNLMLLDYLSSLAVDHNSMLPMCELLDYCRKSDLDPSVKATMIIFLGQKLKSMNGSTNAIKKILKSINEYMGEPNISTLESRALVSWLQKLAKSGLLNNESLAIGSEFKTTLARFCSSKLDSQTSQELRASFTMVLGETEDGLLSTSSSSKLTRVHRLFWLDRVMKCSGRIQDDPFKIELKPFMGCSSNKETIAQELIVTSFDCYAIALLRKNPKYLSLWKEFIVKRVPAIIKDLANGNATPPLHSWVCQPVQNLDRGTVNMLRISGGGDALDEMFSSFPATTSDIRHEFLMACVNFELIDMDSMRRALGAEAAASVSDNPYNGKPGSDFILDANGNELPMDEVMYAAAQENAEFVQFEDSTILRVVKVFEEVDGVRQLKMAQKLLQLVSDWLGENNSRCLRRLSQALCTQLGALDALMLHIQPVQLVVPLAKYLDEWKENSAEEEDDDETNFQDLYTDFGCILLLIVLLYNRYDLDISDVHSQGFVSNLVDPNSDPIMNMDDLSPQLQNLLGEWIVALFDSSGIGDDLMKMTTVKDLMVLSPIILQQAIHARAKNVIDSDTLKGGMEYFLQPFLLGTLVGGFKYLVFNLWENDDPSVTLQVIQTLTVPTGMSGDATSIHTAVMNVISTRLAKSLDLLSAKTPPVAGSVELSQITNAVSTHVISDDAQEPDQQNSLVGALKEQVMTLTNWVHGVELGHVTGPPDYKPHVVSQAVDVLGARTVMRVFLDELDVAEAQGSLEFTLDVISSLILVFDSIHKDQQSYRPNRNRLDSSMLAILLDSSEQDVLALRAKGDTFEPSVVLTCHKKLKKRVDKLMKQCDAVRITPLTNANVGPPELPPSGANPLDAMGNITMNNRPTATTSGGADHDGGGGEPTNNNTTTNDDIDSNMFDPNGGSLDVDPLMGLDMMNDDGLFGDDMMLDNY